MARWLIAWSLALSNSAHAAVVTTETGTPVRWKRQTIELVLVESDARNAFDNEGLRNALRSEGASSRAIDVPMLLGIDGMSGLVAPSGEVVWSLPEPQ